MPLKITDELPYGADRVVLFGYDTIPAGHNVKPWANIQMLSQDGAVIWTVNGMSLNRYGWSRAKDETFVMITAHGEALFAITFGCAKFQIDPKSGRATYVGLTK